MQVSHLMIPEVGERIQVYRDNHLVAEGRVQIVNESFISIRSSDLHVKNLRMRKFIAGLADGSIAIERLKEASIPRLWRPLRV